MTVQQRQKSGDSATTATGDSLREYTWEELKQTGFDNEDDAILLAIRGDVWRIDTDFIGDHPGGRATLRLGEGRDCSALFESYHNTKGKGFEWFCKSRGLANKVTKVGTLVTNEFPKSPPMSEFFQVLKDRTEKRVRETGIDARFTHFGWQAWRLGVLWFFIFGGFYASLFVPGVPTWAALAAICVSGCFKAMMGFHTMHDCSHSAMTKYGNFSQAIGHICNTFISGHSFLSWQHQHVIGHHLYCNVKGVDPDVSGDALRFSWLHEWKPRHRHQWLWAPFAYCLLSWFHRVEDVLFFIEGHWGRIWARKLHFSDWAIYFGGLAFCLSWQLLLPVYFGVSFWWAWFVMQVGEAAGSFMASTCFIVSHVADGCHMSTIEDEGEELKMDWAMLQVKTTQDYGEDSFWNFWLSGGLNFQIVHHLLPGISLMHYRDIQPVVKKTCLEYGYPYNHKPNFWEAFKSHYKLLHYLGEPAKMESKLA